MTTRSPPSPALVGLSAQLPLAAFDVPLILSYPTTAALRFLAIARREAQSRFAEADPRLPRSLSMFFSLPLGPSPLRSTRTSFVTHTRHRTRPLTHASVIVVIFPITSRVYPSISSCLPANFFLATLPSDFWMICSPFLDAQEPSAEWVIVVGVVVVMLHALACFLERPTKFQSAPLLIQYIPPDAPL